MMNDIESIEPIELENMDKDDLEDLRMSLLKDLAKDEFSAFCEYCIPDTEDGGYIKLQPFHREWCELVMTYDRLVLFSMVESGKSTIISQAYPMWLLGKNPNERIVIISSTYEQACKFLSFIREHIITNERIHEVFPNLKPAMDPIKTHTPLKWSEDAIVVERTKVLKEYSIQAMGVEGPLLNARITRMILDDVVNLKNSLSPRWSKKIIEWYDTTANTRLVPGSQCIVVGTAWGETTLPFYLAAKTEWHSAKYSVEPEDIKLGHRLASWPTRWTRERLDKRKAHNPVEYDRMMRNIARTAGKYPFADYIDGVVKDVQLDDSYKFIFGCDLSTKSRVGTVIVVVAYSDKYNERIVWDIEMGAWNANQKKRKLIYYYDKYHPLKIVVESNSLQDDLVDIYKTYKGSDGQYLPIRGVDTRERNKNLWLFEFEQELSNGLWIINNTKTPSFDRLKDEIELYPDYETTDCLMALLFASSGMPKTSGRSRVRSTVIRTDMESVDSVLDGERSIVKASDFPKYGFKDYQLFHRKMQREGYDKHMPKSYKNIVAWIQNSLDYDKKDKWVKPNWATEEEFHMVLNDMVEYVKGLRE